MNVLFTAGGTLGHIYPAISIINEYKRKRPNDKIYFITTNKDIEYLNYIKHEIDYIHTFDVLGISKNPFKLCIALYKNIIAYYKIKRLLMKNKINVVFGMGGYISGICIKAAFNLKIKTAIHEQNSIMGRSNKMSLKMTDVLFTTFEMDVFHKNKYIVGNPRYDDVRKYLNEKEKNKKHILITSGTNGSKVINDFAVEFLNSSESLNYYTTLVTGKRYYDDILNKIKKGNHYEVISFSNQMINLFNKSGIVITRSGSTTISEILGLKCIPIFIPSPNVVNNHQYFNALNVVNNGVGILIEEKDLNLNSALEMLKNVSSNYETYIYNLNKYSYINNTKLIIDKIIELGDNDE